MWVKNLELKNYRNYRELNIDFSKTFNIIYGENAQGKTNIIEAMFLCASGRSHRTSRDQELIRNGEEGFEVKIVLDRNNREEIININYGGVERKRIKINGIPAKRIGDLMGHLNAVMFSPEDLLIIKQGPSERRRFIDMALSQVRPVYFFELQQYARILFQRNSLLKNLNSGNANENVLEIWDRHIAKTGSRIIKSRAEMVERLNILAEARHDKLTGGKERLKLIYRPSIPVDKGSTSEDIENAYRKTLDRNRREEIRRGATMDGPHRDDVDIMLNNENARIYGSQGQQRTAVLSMKTAEIDLMREESGDFPVLLLDDVFSELDAERKKHLLESIESVQTFITSTEKEILAGEDADAALFHVSAGRVQTGGPEKRG